MLIDFPNNPIATPSFDAHGNLDRLGQFFGQKYFSQRYVAAGVRSGIRRQLLLGPPVPHAPGGQDDGS